MNLPAGNENSQYWIIIPAAGSGSRMQESGSDAPPKQYLKINEQTILNLTLQRLDQITRVTGIVLVLAENDSYWPQTSIELSRPLLLATGGSERIHSVYNGLQTLKGKVCDSDWILVHDAVRPCIDLADVNRLIDELAEDEIGGLLATPVTETLKKITKGLTVESTVPREDYWRACTPQMFRFGVLKQALATALEEKRMITDEAHAMETAGHSVKLVHCGADNIKITHSEDLILAEYIINRQTAS